ncbi:MAG: nuclease (SNase domain protein) [Gallionellaceae bacterium]|nr:MAG: nuclease (SNase domain protein) [Gallionellaceae bacterium]
MRFLAALFALVALNAQAESFEAKVLTVMDGDTVFVKTGPFKAKLRLVNIDAPEKDQSFGPQSRESLQSLIGGKVVHVESKAVDKFGRTIALISIGDINVNEEQVRRGMAWASSRSREGHAYVKLQNEAQQAKRGLWHEANPQQPSQWRKLHPAEPTKYRHQQQRKAQPQTQKPERFGTLACGKKSYCSQMVTCDEAHFYLTVCGEKRLDTNKDGIPCESLCGVLE